MANREAVRHVERDSRLIAFADGEGESAVTPGGETLNGEVEQTRPEVLTTVFGKEAELSEMGYLGSNARAEQGAGERA